MISFIIPTLNEEKVIRESLESLKEYKGDSEIIVSDGGSSDRTVAIAQNYADKVLVYRGQSRQNIAQGRNAGMRTASGEFLVFLDADVFIPDINNFFKKILQRFSSSPKLAAITVKIKVLPEQETWGDKIILGLQDWVLRIENNLFHVGQAGGEFQMMKKEAAVKAGGFDEKLITREDSDMFLRLSKIGKTEYYGRLTAFHTGRRAHRIGWLHLLSIWFINTIWVILFKKSYSKEWSVIR